MQQVTENIFVETEFQGCNTGFLKTSEGLIQVDSPHRPTDGKKYKEEIGKYGEVKYFINTEPHGDHITSNFLFDTTFVAHQGTRDRMSNKEVLERTQQQLGMIDPDFASNMDDFFIPLPDITFEDSMTLYVGKHTLKLVNMPGHTASETAVVIPEENAVFTGDNIFCNLPVFMHEAFPAKWLESLEKLKELDAEIYIPGHGEVCGKDYLDKQAEVVQEWIDVLKTAVDKGWSIEEAQEQISFLDRYPLDEERKVMVREMEKVGIANVYNQVKSGEI